MAEESKLADKYEEQTKFSEEEMEVLKEIQTSYLEVQQGIGQVSIARIRLEQQMEGLSEADFKLREQFLTNQTKEQEFIKSITEKYGDGVLNKESGTFTPNKPE